MRILSRLVNESYVTVLCVQDGCWPACLRHSDIAEPKALHAEAFMFTQSTHVDFTSKRERGTCNVQPADS